MSTTLALMECWTILLNDPEVEAVHVCSIHKVHAEQVVAAARAGKHVLVEKPMALSVAECDRMIDACEDAGVVLMVGQVMRHFPVNLKVKELIREGAIGEVWAHDSQAIRQF